MSDFQTDSDSKIQKPTSFLKKPLNTKYLNFLYIAIFAVPIFLITFQNCQKSNVNRPLEGSTSTGNITYKIGSIVQIDSTNGNIIEDSLLPTNSNVTFQFVNADPASNNYKWTIKRGFDSIVTDTRTDVDTYQTSLSGLGAHDVFAKSYESENLKTTANKRFVVGASCSPYDILEIKLLPEKASSFKTGGSPTFGLKDSANFSSIKWKATLPSGQSTTNQTGINTLSVDLSSESMGALLLEVSATSSDPSRTGCLTYRQKSLSVSSNVRPYLNPISFTDGINNLSTILENNDIYKYTRTDTNRFVQVEILNANSCQYKIDNNSKVNFNCSGQPIQIASSLDTGCTEGTVTFSASNTQGGVLSKSFYHYCPSDSDYCYFGYLSSKPGHHICPIELLSQRTQLELDPAPGRCGTVQNTCQIGQPHDTPDTSTHYQWQCLGIGSGATTDCQAQIPVTTTPITTPPSITTATTPPLVTLPPVVTTTNGQCNNNVRYSCLSPGVAINKTTSAGFDRWHCPGSGNPIGATATNCQRQAPTVNGVCDLSDISRNNICSIGTPIDVADTADEVKWQCAGLNGGTTDNCTRPNFGACGAGCTGMFCATSSCTTRYNCHVKDVNGTCYPSCGYSAHLIGYGGYGPGQTAPNNPDKTDDPHAYTSSTCASLDTSSKYANTAFTPFRNFAYIEGRKPWEVVERGGTCCIRDKSTSTSSSTTTTLSSSQQVTCGQCNTSEKHKCSLGDFHSHPGDNTTLYRWTCRNKPHVANAQCPNGRREIQCNRIKAQAVVNGACDSECGYCESGYSSMATPFGLVGDPCEWTCSGSNGGADDSCTGVFTEETGGINP